MRIPWSSLGLIKFSSFLRYTVLMKLITFEVSEHFIFGEPMRGIISYVRAMANIFIIW